MALWLRIPASVSSSSDSTEPSSAAGAGGDGGCAAVGARERLAADPWEWWNQLRFLCHHNNRLGVVLELGADLPSAEDLQRWRGEPLKWVGPTGNALRVGMAAAAGIQSLLGAHMHPCSSGGVEGGSAAASLPCLRACRRVLRRCPHSHMLRAGCSKPLRTPSYLFISGQPWM